MGERDAKLLSRFGGRVLRPVLGLLNIMQTRDCHDAKNSLSSHPDRLSYDRALASTQCDNNTTTYRVVNANTRSTKSPSGRSALNLRDIKLII